MGDDVKKEEEFLDGPVFKADDKPKKPDYEFKGGEWVELFKTCFFAIFIALLVRIFLFEPFNIPSGSMKPTLLVGDYLFVTKYSYGYSMHSVPFSPIPFEGRIYGKKPQRGDVAVFKLPSDMKTDYIKRVIGLPGDTVQVIGRRLYINGERVKREKIDQEIEEKQITPYFSRRVTTTRYKETLPNGVSHYIYEEGDNGPLDNTVLYKVPAGHYFMMGDNRDNSQDSRVTRHVGPVPYDNFVGRAERIFFSLDADTRIWEIWKWPFALRYGRLFDSLRVKPEADLKTETVQ